MRHSPWPQRVQGLSGETDLPQWPWREGGATLAQMLVSLGTQGGGLEGAWLAP